MAANHGAIDHAGPNATQHGFITMHLDKAGTKAAALNAVRGLAQTIQNNERVAVLAPHDVDDLIVQYVEDTAGRSMDQFHLALGSISAQYWTLTAQAAAGAAGARYFAWVHYL